MVKSLYISRKSSGAGPLSASFENIMEEAQRVEGAISVLLPIFFH
jgi:hypothetical protein